MLSVFECQGLVHYRFAPRGQTVHKEFHVKVYHHLWDTVYRNDQNFGWNAAGFINHNNSLANMLCVQNFLVKNKILVVPQAPNLQPQSLFSSFSCSQNCNLVKLMSIWTSREDAKKKNARPANPNVFKTMYGMLVKNGIIIGIFVLIWVGTMAKEIVFN